ncbi:hypothetical protein AVEN_179729-1, partial [Araneus ventricosus]
FANLLCAMFLMSPLRLEMPLGNSPLLGYFTETVRFVLSAVHPLAGFQGFLIAHRRYSAEIVGRILKLSKKRMP